MKAVSKSVSMPDAIWDKVETHAPKTAGRDRSGYIRNLVEADLNAAGVLVAGHNIQSELIAAAEDIGIEEAIATLKREAAKKKRRAA